MVDPDKRIYVRYINFSGNVRTQSRVIRQQMVQTEGGLASSEKIEESKVNLQRLGFFNPDVKVDVKPVSDNPDQVDLDYGVTEANSGSIYGSVGYGRIQGLILGAGVNQDNWLGTGKRVSFNVQRSNFEQNYQFSTYDPFYTVGGISRGFNVYYSRTNYDKADLTSSITNSVGGNVTFGYPISRTQRLRFSLGYDFTTIRLSDYPAQEVQQFVAENGKKFSSYLVTTNWINDTRNRGFFPTDGHYQELGLNVAVPGSDLNYYKLHYDGRYYQPIGSKGWVLRFRTDLGFGQGYGKNKRLPYFQNYFAGGVGSVRGYDFNSLGPRSTPNVKDPDRSSLPFGGNALATGSIDLIFPTPFVKDKDAFRTALYFAGGNVYQTDPYSNLNKTNVRRKGGTNGFRYSTGASFSWRLPIVGVLTFSVGIPIGDKNDDTRFFDFALGQSF
jgi:outer membrane protein insertion porin family